MKPAYDSHRESCAIAGRGVQSSAHPLSHPERSRYNAALRERCSLTVWLDPSPPWHRALPGKRAVQPVYSDAAIQACLVVKVLSVCRSGKRWAIWRAC